MQRSLRGAPLSSSEAEALGGCWGSLGIRIEALRRKVQATRIHQEGAVGPRREDGGRKGLRESHVCPKAWLPSEE